MRKTAIALLALGLASLVAAPGHAVVLMSEPFNYPDGNLAISPSVSGGNWANHSGSGTDIQVVSGRAVGSMANAPDDNRSFAEQGASGKTYACFTLRIPTPASAPVSNYFAHLKDTGTFNFMSRVYVMPSGNSFTLGLSLGSCASPCSPAAWGSALSYDTDYIVVISYDAAAGSSELWVDPISEASTKITHATVSGGASTGTLISSFALRQSSTGGAAWGFEVDNIGVGTTFSDACNSGPTPTRGSSWGELKSLYR